MREHTPQPDSIPTNIALACYQTGCQLAGNCEVPSYAEGIPPLARMNIASSDTLKPTTLNRVRREDPHHDRFAALAQDDHEHRQADPKRGLRTQCTPSSCAASSRDRSGSRSFINCRSGTYAGPARSRHPRHPCHPRAVRRLWRCYGPGRLPSPRSPVHGLHHLVSPPVTLLPRVTSLHT
jgi:hypothetical protein